VPIVHEQFSFELKFKSSDYYQINNEISSIKLLIIFMNAYEFIIYKCIRLYFGIKWQRYLEFQNAVRPTCS